MPRRRPPSERDDQQLYGQETRLIDNHGPRNPGPDPDRFPVPADEQSDGTEPAGRKETPPARRRRKRGPPR
jgi:hypothetical protein